MRLQRVGHDWATFTSLHILQYRASQVTEYMENMSASAGDARDAGLIPVLERSPREGNGNSLQYSCLENPMNRRAWQALGVQIARHDLVTNNILHYMVLGVGGSEWRRPNWLHEKYGPSPQPGTLFPSASRTKQAPTGESFQSQHFPANLQDGGSPAAPAPRLPACPLGAVSFGLALTRDCSWFLWKSLKPGVPWQDI